MPHGKSPRTFASLLLSTISAEIKFQAAASLPRFATALAALVSSLSLGRRPCQTRLSRIGLNLAEVV
jgi:hypothetical protein